MNGHRIDFLLHERSVGLRVDGELLEFVERLKAINDPAENGVLEIESRLGCVGDEELALVGVDAGVCHREEAALAMLEILLKLILELLAPNRLSALSRVGGVAGLHHEALNVPYEDATVVIV